MEPDQQQYPFLLHAVAKEKVWGGRRLAELLGKALPTAAMIGETWEAWEGCTIENGAFQGMSLNAVIERDPAGILGAGQGARGFPLLFKFIDAQDDLSVQVHPNDTQAQSMERQPYGKTEAWYILHADPGAGLIVGFREDASLEQVKTALRENKLVDLLAFLPVQPGDVVFVPAGTVHAIGKGIVLAEIQENSDITFRFYDWGRVGKGRDLHIAQSLEVGRFKRMVQPKVPPIAVKYPSFVRTYLVACRYFAFERLDLLPGKSRFSTGSKFNIFSVIQGQTRFFWGRDFQESITIAQGQTLILPAGLGEYEMAPVGQSCQALIAYVPDLSRDLIHPLLEAGYDRAAIERLGGAIPEQNDLVPLLAQ